MGSPILNQKNIRYIGQPNGQLQKVLYLSQQVGSSNSLVTKPIINKTMSQITPLQKGTIVAQGNIGGSTISKMTGPIRNLAIKNAVPVFLNPQGVPLKVVNSSPIPAGVSIGFPGRIISKITTNSQVKISPSATNSTPTSQHLQGLKKAVEQVAAVTQINAQLQNHLEKKDKLIPAANQHQYVPLLGNQILLKGVKSEATLLNIANIKTFDSKPLVVNNGKFIIPKQNTVKMSMQNVISNVSVQPVQPKKVVNTIQPGISYILTSNGLVGVSTPMQVPQNRNTLSTTQNIITSKMPSHVLASRAVHSSKTSSNTSASTLSINKMHPQILSNAVLSSVVNANTKVSPSIKGQLTILPASSVNPGISVNNATSSVFINKLPSNILLSRPIAATTNIASVSKIISNNKTLASNNNSSAGKEQSTPNIFKNGNDVTPEKLRDAEALLGLINPMHHSPQTSSSAVLVSPKSVTTAIIKPKKKENTIVSPSPDLIKRALYVNQAAVYDNNQLKISIPNSQTGGGTILPSTLRLPQKPSMGTPQVKNTAPLISAEVAGHKMVVNASQLKKLHEEGKVVVTPNGQMFLMTGTNQLPTASNSKS